MLITLIAIACGGNGSKPAATQTPVAATATVAASPTPDPRLSKDVNGAAAVEDVRRLSAAPRVAGTDADKSARDFVEERLKSLGYDVEIQEFSFDSSRYRPATVSVDGAPRTAVSLNGSPISAASGALIDAGIGRPDQFPTGGMHGGIALIERGDLMFSAKIANAAAAGAAGAIIFNNTDEGLFAGDAPGATIPAVAIKREDGLALRDKIAASGSSAANAEIKVLPLGGTAYNVIARPAGVHDCTTVTGGHYDSVPVSPGADDNASGSAAVLEVARLAMANGLPGANCFVLFGAEEFGLWGSMHFVETLSPEEIQGIRAMLNLDVVGTSTGLTLIGSPDVVEVARVAAQDLGIDATQGSIPMGSSSDFASFQSAGVPNVFFYRPDNMIHTPSDAIDRIDEKALEDSIRVAYATLEDVAGKP